MALNIYLEGTLNGEPLEETEHSTPTSSMGGDDVSGMIEVLSLETGIGSPTRGGSSPRRTGRIRMEPIQFVFRATGKTWPQWLRGCDRHEEFEGTFRLYRTEPSDGGVERSGAIVVERGRVLSVRFLSPGTLDPATADAPPTLHVTVAYHTMTWTSEDGPEHTVSGTVRT